MKKLAFIAGIALLATACNEGVKKENKRLENKVQKLEKTTRYQDSTINEFAKAFERIQNNLQAIRKREESIQKAKEGGFEKSENVRQKVISDVSAINELLKDNQETIANLRDKIKRYSTEVGKYKNMMDKLNQQVEAKNKEVAILKQDLAAANFEVEKMDARIDTMSKRNKAQRERLEEQNEKLNTAYYAVGTFDDLEENEVLEKKGGIIGIGSTKTLADNFNKDYFTEIDKSKTSEIPLEVKDADVILVSNHPSGSYKLNKTEDAVKSLQITDAGKFWNSTKYLVILID